LSRKWNSLLLSVLLFLKKGRGAEILGEIGFVNPGDFVSRSQAILFQIKNGYKEAGDKVTRPLQFSLKKEAAGIQRANTDNLVNPVKKKEKTRVK